MGADNDRRPAIGPKEFATLVKVFNAVAAEPGFSPDEVQRHILRRYIIARFRGGMTDAVELESHCREIARLPLLP